MHVLLPSLVDKCTSFDAHNEARGCLSFSQLLCSGRIGAPFSVGKRGSAPVQRENGLARWQVLATLTMFKCDARLG